jgi:membrane protease YdiL (CAAX protease family)
MDSPPTSAADRLREAASFNRKFPIRFAILALFLYGMGFLAHRLDWNHSADREEGKTPKESIYQVCLLRFRPIMMTTMAALLGALPLAIQEGIGSELRKPLGIIIVGGLLVSQILTLYITPVYFVYIEHARLWLAGRRPEARRQRQAAPVPIRSSTRV